MDTSTKKLHWAELKWNTDMTALVQRGIDQKSDQWELQKREQSVAPSESFFL